MSHSDQLSFRFNQIPEGLIGKPFKWKNKVIGTIIKVEDNIVTTTIDNKDIYKEIWKELEMPKYSMGCKYRRVINVEPLNRSKTN